jgi:hypothetical protein
MTLIDYAAPMMRIETLLKDMHNSLLDKDMDEAHKQVVLLLVECRVLQNTLTLMREKEELHAIRQQAPTLQERI